MKRFLMIGIAIAVSVSLLLISCKKDEKRNEVDHHENSFMPELIQNAVTDIDGNDYDAVQIGNQLWMAENLRTSHYADGTTIPMGSTWSYTEPYRYAPGEHGSSNGENLANVARYGYLYNWKAVMHNSASSASNPSGVQGVCPEGWHVPSDAEWTQLTDYVSHQSRFVCGYDNINVAKALASASGWKQFDDWFHDGDCVVGNNQSANNATGFSALPAGGYGGSFGYFGSNAYFWSTTGFTESYAFNRSLYYNYAFMGKSILNEDFAFSVRCVRD